jgi:hypothetical protein
MPSSGTTSTLTAVYGQALQTHERPGGYTALNLVPEKPID